MWISQWNRKFYYRRKSLNRFNKYIISHQYAESFNEIHGGNRIAVESNFIFFRSTEKSFDTYAGKLLSTWNWNAPRGLLCNWRVEQNLPSLYRLHNCSVEKRNIFRMVARFDMSFLVSPSSTHKHGRIKLWVKITIGAMGKHEKILALFSSCTNRMFSSMGMFPEVRFLGHIVWIQNVRHDSGSRGSRNIARSERGSRCWKFINFAS